ncbi:adenylate cyclase [Bradyrhizobium sp. CCBAU 53421]|uniref:adenylate cyclase n=1 Tax=Bradyrhizobium sp. CCBAU 53421 TaxID=1325120 RepID=UPI00188D0FA8|nr:adenylate cyclase [Bradyrhizobium sp. CCBAU 53421]
MKRMTASLAIGACLLLASAGVALAANPHPSTTSGKGQPGSNNGVACNTGSVGGGPGGSANGGGSPFNPTPTTPNGIVYAGNPGNPTAQPGGVGNPDHAVSQYDVACFQASQMP